MELVPSSRIGLGVNWKKQKLMGIKAYLFLFMSRCFTPHLIIIWVE